MRIDRTSSERTPPGDSEDSGTIPTVTIRPFVQRHFLSGLAPNLGVLRTTNRNTLSRFVESDEEPISIESTMDWNSSWPVEDRHGMPVSSEEDSPDYPPGLGLLPSSSEISLDFHPFFLHQPRSSSESLFPCPEGGSRPGQIRRRYLETSSNGRSGTRRSENRRTLEDANFTNTRSNSRRRLNRWPAVTLDSDFAIPCYSAFLDPGRSFIGFQRCSSSSKTEWNEFTTMNTTTTTAAAAAAPVSSAEEWSAQVQIKEYRPDEGYLCGTMKAYVKPESPVITFWEGEIIDNKNYTFKTQKWTASFNKDMDHWRRFQAFRNLNCPLLSDCSKVPGLKEYPYIFMRWKEMFFVTKPEENTLTIQGFYYICLSRETGVIDGYYYDPQGNPYQELQMKPDRNGKTGFTFSHYKFR
eukprot:g3457.t1